MRKLFLIVFCMSFVTLSAQRHEIGVFLGGANVIGDIGKSDYINPLPVKFQGRDSGYKIPYVIGGLYRFNFNNQMGLRANILYSKVAGTDHASEEYYKQDRNYSFKNTIIEGSIMFEYNFFDLNSIQKSAHSPYIFVGVGAFGTNGKKYQVIHSLHRDSEGNIDLGDGTDPTYFETAIEDKNKTVVNWTVPFGAGYKFKINYDWVLSFELGFRPTFIDNLDHSKTAQKDIKIVALDDIGVMPIFEDEVNRRNEEAYNSRNVGNLSNNDWYVFTGFSLTYAFGRPPCYCD